MEGKKTILSVCDRGGSWALPYAENGYQVVLVDPEQRQQSDETATILSKRIEDIVLSELSGVYGILAAPPCTDFSVSGAQYWDEKDRDGRTAGSLAIVDWIISAVNYLQPRFWALENPVGRLSRLRPELGDPWYFQPWWFGDPYTKKTGLWGNFNRNLPRQEVEPIRACKQGSWLMKLGGKSDKTKELRAKTPIGFAYAFFCANM